MTATQRPVSAGTPGPTPLAGVSEVEWGELVELGRASGSIHADQIAHVFREVELNEDNLGVITGALAVLGIEIDDRVEHDDTPAGGVEADEERLDERLLDRRRTSRRSRRGRAEEGGGDSVRMYLRDIGRVDLLTVEEERRLAQLVEQGAVAATAIDAGVDDPAEVRRLTRQVTMGERARSELTQANLRLVVSIAKRYSNRGVQLLDLVQEGNLGVAWTGNVSHAATIDVLGLDGRVMATRSWNVIPGAQRTSIDVSSLASGIYLVRLSAGDLQRIQRVVIR